VTVLEKALQWLIDAIKDLAEEIIGLVLDALASILEAIPVPDWMQSIDSSWSALPSGVWYFAETLNLTYGLTVVVSAYGLRFLIRRLPIFG
jgi:hypothetical protein